ncbi:anion permease, partial [bacterium]|nr:anion permease [bacterium]
SNLKIFGGLYLGWGIGANDSANIFGTAVATNSVKYRTAIILIAIFVILGSATKGWQLYKHYDFSKKSSKSGTVKTDANKDEAAVKAENYTNALLSTLAAAIAVTIVTVLSIPASTSQAAVGAYMGIIIATSGGLSGINWSQFLKMFICWIATPIGSAIITIFLYKTVSKVLNFMFGNNLGKLNRIYSFLLIIAGCYGAFELGANNVVVTTGPYYVAGVFGTPLHGEFFDKASFWNNPAFWAALLGGIAIAIGALTYSKNVMYTVGKKITALDPYSAMITVFSHSIALMIFTQLRVPVSSSQAIVGAVIGIGMLSGSNTISYKTLGFIFLGWLLTPLAGAGIAYFLRLLLTITGI